MAAKPSAVGHGPTMNPLARMPLATRRDGASGSLGAKTYQEGEPPELPFFDATPGRVTRS